MSPLWGTTKYQQYPASYLKSSWSKFKIHNSLLQNELFWHIMNMLTLTINRTASNGPVTHETIITYHIQHWLMMVLQRSHSQPERARGRLQMLQLMWMDVDCWFSMDTCGRLLCLMMKLAVDHSLNRPSNSGEVKHMNMLITSLFVISSYETK